MRASRTIALLMPLALTATLTARQARPAVSGDVLPFKATERTLPNGLKVIIVPTGFPNIVSMQIPVQTGSRNEVEPGKSGFAHFFEHLMFRGTPNTPPEKYQQIMVKAGASENASTGDDFTRYYATFAKEDLPVMLATYADMFENLSYAEADFKTEARAILGEYNKNSAEPLEQLFEVQRDTFYTAHTYKHTTMGFIKDIENMPNEYQYSKTFFERWYRPRFTTLIVAGDVTADEVMPLVEKYWGGWKAGAPAQVQIPQEPAPKKAQYAHVTWPADTLPWVTVGYLGPAFDAERKDTPAMQILAALSFGPTSDLYKRLVVTEQKVDALEVDTPAGVDPSLFTVLARVKNPNDAVYVRDQILAAIADARRGPVAAGRLADAKSFNKYAFARSLDSTERIAAVISAYAPYRRSYDTINTYYRTLDSLQPADLQAAAKKYFVDNSLIVTTLSHDPLPQGITDLPSLDAMKPATADHARKAPALVVPPIPAAANAGAGTNIPLVQQKSALPQLDVKLLFDIGSAYDPPGKEGLAMLTAAMITEAGSAAMTIDQIDTALYPMAGAFNSRVDKEMTSFTGYIHKDNWQRFLAIVLPQLLDPGFREADFTRLKAAQLNALTQDLRSNNEEELGKEELQIDVFHGTPYAHTALGTVASINAITLDDVKDFREDDVYAREPDARGERRRAARDAAHGPGEPREAARRACRAEGRRSRGTPGRDSREHPRKGHPRDRHLVRLPARRDPVGSGFRGALSRAGLARRAPRLVRAAVPADPPGPRDELRRLRLHRSIPARNVPVLPRPQHRAPAAALRDLDPAGRARQRAHGPAHRDVRAAATHRQGTDEGGLRGHA